MELPWLLIWEVTLTVAVLWSTAFTLFLVTLPSRYQPAYAEPLREDDFSTADKQAPAESGYEYFEKHKGDDGTIRPRTSVQIVVLGDIGRSPRMQYHALSIARHGGHVQLIGYAESDLHPEVTASRFIRVVPVTPFPRLLQTGNKLLFLVLGPLKVLWQIGSLYHALAYQSRASKFMLVQNPPSIPTLAIAQLICLFRGTRLVVDWHNFGYSILALRLGHSHPLVKVSQWYEGRFAKGAFAHFCVTNAMADVLLEKWEIKAVPLHDRPPAHFQPLSASQRSTVLRRLEQTTSIASEMETGQRRLVVSATSWTPDEDFAILLDALVTYSSAVSQSHGQLPRLSVIITGKGPQKEHYLDKVRTLQKSGKLAHMDVVTAWLSATDYAALLGAADLGISLHTSSSGVDLPMKVVDMFGTGLPVAGWNRFKAWPELVTEGQNGRGFDSSDGLSSILQDLFGDDGARLNSLRKGATRECSRRWEDEWMPVAGRLFQLDAS